MIYHFVCWGIEPQYDRITANMTKEQVSSLLGGESEIKVHVRFNFGEGKSEVRTAEAWKFRRLGKPYFVIVGFGANGQVSFKQFGENAGKRFGSWVFNRRTVYFEHPRPLWMDVLDEESEGNRWRARAREAANTAGHREWHCHCA